MVVEEGDIEEGRPSLQLLGKPGICDSLCKLKWNGISEQSAHLLQILHSIDGLTHFQRHTLATRFITVLEDIRSRAGYFSVWFFTGRTVITVGSLIVPALLSIQYSTTVPDNMQHLPNIIYWITWFASLLVTTFNGILTLFKIDKKYYFLHTTLEQLNSEAWQYIHLSGKYSGYYIKGDIATHANQYVYFCHNLEKIKLKQIEEEYYKWLDNQQNSTTQAKAKIEDNHTIHNSEKSQIDEKTIAGLYTPTPDQNQLIKHQREIAHALHNIPQDTLEDGEGNHPKKEGRTTKNSIHNGNTKDIYGESEFE